MTILKHWGPSWSYGSWIYNYLCNQCLSPLTLWVQISFRRGVLDTTLCNKVCQWLATGRWFSSGTPVSFTSKTSHHDIAEILLKVASNPIRLAEILISVRILYTFIKQIYHIVSPKDHRSVFMVKVPWLLDGLFTRSIKYITKTIEPLDQKVTEVIFYGKSTTKVDYTIKWRNIICLSIASHVVCLSYVDYWLY